MSGKNSSLVQKGIGKTRLNLALSQSERGARERLLTIAHYWPMLTNFRFVIPVSVEMGGCRSCELRIQRNC